MRFTLIAVALALPVSACAGRTVLITDDGGPSAADSAPGTMDGAGPPLTTGPDPAAVSYDYCAELSARRCSENGKSSSKCAREKRCFDNVLRPGVALPLEQCLARRACSTSEETCYDMAAAPYESAAGYLAFVEACLTKNKTCGKATSSSLCRGGGGLAMIRENILTEMKACFDRECGSVDPCIETKITGLGCDN